MNIFTEIEAILPLLQIVLLYIDSVNSSSSQKGFSHPVPDFNYHTIVEPVLYHNKLQQTINRTKESNGFHVEHLFIRFNVDEEIFELDLLLNKQLLADKFFHKYQENGTDKIHSHNKKDADLCEYQGKIRRKHNSWAAISTCDGLNGVIFDGVELHYISSQRKKLDSKKSNYEHFLYSHSNIATNNKSCGEKRKDEKIFRYERNLAQKSTIRGPYNADKLSKYVETYLVVNYEEYEKLGKNRNRVIQRCKSIFNIVNAFYSSLNIFVVLIGIEIWTEANKIRFSGDTLHQFADYRVKKILRYHPNDNAQLLGRFRLGGNIVGQGFIGTICSHQQSVAVNVDHSEVVGVVAGTIAHELGHNFGMHHDGKTCQCPGKHCIMSDTSSSQSTLYWSSCSLTYLMMSFAKGLDRCLRNKPTHLLSSPVCGNGFVEIGEECDCGLPAYCNNTCCNAKSCMLSLNATCASGDCCDLSICKLKNAGVLCRSADYECDLPEHCTGQSEYCPADTYKMDTQPCNGGKAYCYRGYCRTRTDQCKLLWGLGGESCHEVSYKDNKNGSPIGNCGHDKFRGTFIKCRDKDKLCGSLHCKTLSDKPEFGLTDLETALSVYTTLITIPSKNIIVSCRSISGTSGSDVFDPALVPNGASCGNASMCVNQTCMSVKSLRSKGRDCYNNCKNGWCNNLGHCHCKDGFAPPNCELKGPGGSVDSGPGTNIQQGDLHLLEIFGSLGGIALVIAICAFVYYYCFKGKDVHTSIMARCPSICPPFRSTRVAFIYVFQTWCIGLFNKMNFGDQKATHVSEHIEHDTEKNPSIIIEHATLIFSTNPEGVANSSFITETTGQLKKIARSDRQIETLSTNPEGVANSSYITEITRKLKKIPRSDRQIETLSTNIESVSNSSNIAEITQRTELKKIVRVDRQIESSSTYPEGVANRSYITETTGQLKKIAESNRQIDSSEIATISYPQVGKKGGKVSSLAQEFEKINFKKH